MNHSKYLFPFSHSLDLRPVRFSNKNHSHNSFYSDRMNTNDVLKEYGLTRETATNYIDAITRSNQTQTAEELDVSRDTINRYKNAFSEMNAQERLLLISSLTQEKLLEKTTEGDLE